MAATSDGSNGRMGPERRPTTNAAADHVLAEVRTLLSSGTPLLAGTPVTNVTVDLEGGPGTEDLVFHFRSNDGRSSRPLGFRHEATWRNEPSSSNETPASWARMSLITLAEVIETTEIPNGSSTERLWLR